MRKSLFIAGLIAVFTLIVALIIQIFTSYYIYNYQGNIPSDYRVAVVFGAKVQANGQPTRFLKDRLDAAIRLYKEDQVDVILLSGEKLHENFNEIDVMEKYCWIEVSKLKILISMEQVWIHIAQSTEPKIFINLIK